MRLLDAEPSDIPMSLSGDLGDFLPFRGWYGRRGSGNDAIFQHVSMMHRVKVCAKFEVHWRCL